MANNYAATMRGSKDDSISLSQNYNMDIEEVGPTAWAEVKLSEGPIIMP